MFTTLLKNFIIFVCCLFAISFTSIFAYVRPEGFDPETWASLERYFLPENHSIKKKLDEIFVDSHPLIDVYALRSVGFNNLKIRRNGMIVASHPKLKNYKLKIYLHNALFPEWTPFTHRIDGAELIRESIKRHKYQKLFVVPKKWIYPLPPTIPAPGIEHPKYFVMIVQDMHLYSKSSNAEFYRHGISNKQLKALFTIIQENVLIDSVYIDNIACCRGIKIAFIDTEHFLVPDSNIPWQRLLNALNMRKRAYLQKIIDGSLHVENKLGERRSLVPDFGGRGRTLLSPDDDYAWSAETIGFDSSE